MYFKSRFHLKAREGEERLVRKFLLWPRQFKESDWRWLCWATLKEQIVRMDVGGSMEWGKYAWGWREVDFADGETNEEQRIHLGTSGT